MLREVEKNLDKIGKDLDEQEESLNREQERLWSEAIRNMEENLSLSGVSSSELDPSLWSPYGDWREKVRSSFNSSLDVFLGDMRIAINRVKWDKINANNTNSSHKNDYNNGYSSWNSQPPPKGKYDNEKPNFSDKNFSPNDKNGWSGEGKYTPNYTPKYIEEIKDKIEFYKERLLKTSDEREKQKYQEMISNLEKELETLRNQSDNQESRNPKPTTEQVNDAKSKLNEVKDSGKKEDLVNALNETRNTTKNSSDQDLKKEREEVEKKLGEVDKEELRKMIKSEVEEELKKFGIRSSDLSPENKQRLDKLNEINIEPAEYQSIRTEILNESAVKSLDKLISEVERTIKLGDKKKIKSKVEELRRFIEDGSNEYAQNAYSKKKGIVNSLLEKAKNKSSQQNKDGNFFRPNNPAMWLSGVAVIGVVVGAILIVRSRRRDKKMATK